jgi:hypothetical protein
LNRTQALDKTQQTLDRTHITLNQSDFAEYSWEAPQKSSWSLSFARFFCCFSKKEKQPNRRPLASQEVTLVPDDSYYS